ncbi:uncharacterized protein LOC144653084 isoform X2 [Oculina patagonica]
MNFKLVPSTALSIFLLAVFFGLVRTSDDSFPKPAPEKGQNVCAFARVKPQLVLRRNATSARNVIIDSIRKSFPGLTYGLSLGWRRLFRWGLIAGPREARNPNLDSDQRITFYACAPR